MTEDRTDAHTVTWRTAHGKRRRIVFEPRDGEGYERRDECYREGSWEFVGKEIVTHVDIDAPENSDFLSLFPRAQEEGNDGRI